jgi:beta-glucosidase
MSDWVGTYSTVEAINAGLDLEMPGPTKFRGQLLLDAVQEGNAAEATINASARRVLELVKKSGRFEKPDDRNEVYIDSPERDELTTIAAAEATAPLKNHGSALPLKQNSKIVVIGQHAGISTVGGGGSAKVDSARSISPLTGLKEAGVVF